MQPLITFPNKRTKNEFLYLNSEASLSELLAGPLDSHMADSKPNNILSCSFYWIEPPNDCELKKKHFSRLILIHIMYIKICTYGFSIYVSPNNHENPLSLGINIIICTYIIVSLQ